MGNKFEDMIEECEPPGRINLLPFNIEFDGKANIETKFNNRAKPDPDQAENEFAELEFRGRPMQGQQLTIPPNYEGFVATDLKHSSNAQSDNSEEQKYLRLTSKFDSFTYWNWDKPPSGMDLPPKLLDWMHISEILHQPIRIDENQENDSNKAQNKLSN